MSRPEDTVVAARGGDRTRAGSLPDGIVGVVGIGASAGGLKALRQVFSGLPASCDLTFVVVVHLDPGHESHLAELLKSWGPLEVSQIRNGDALRRGHVHVAPPGHGLACAGATLHLTPQGESRHRSVDLFFRSLAETFREHAVAVVLSGAGVDGAEGVCRVKECGGMTIAQEPGSAESDGMPTAAIATGQIDRILTPDLMVREILALVSGRLRPAGASSLRRLPRDLEPILETLFEVTKQDFRLYKSETIRRRIARRMGLLRAKSLTGYLEKLRASPDEARALARDLLITVTGFLRDPKAYTALVEKVIVPLVSARAPNQALRVWVPGCATGEEAYTLAMLFAESLEDRPLTVQIFATDRCEEALQVARAGVYTRDAVGPLGKSRIGRFLERTGGGRFRVKKALRDMVTFARQDLICDPPFSRMDLISCRNLLIYLVSEVQGNLTALFHFALVPGGFLLLGPSESVVTHEHLFEVMSKRWRLYRRRDVPARSRVEFRFGQHVPLVPAEKTERAQTPPTGLAWVRVERALLDQLGASAVLIDGRLQILQFIGATDAYLTMPSREPRFDLISLTRPELAPRLRVAVRKAARSGQPCRTTPVNLGRGHSAIRARATVVPVFQSGTTWDALLVIFERVSRVSRRMDVVDAMAEADLVAELEAELRESDVRLRTKVEEFRSTHEELLSTNEELQSSNEELETSKEELQSLNEELSSLNSQLQEKLEEIEAANSDMANLLQSSESAIIILDEGLRIRHFTSGAQRLLSLISGDIGRPLADLSKGFLGKSLEPDALAVVRSGKPTEDTVSPDGAAWFLRRLLPYRRTGGAIAGVVVTLSDISQIKRAEEHWRRLAAVLSDSNDALTVEDFSGRILDWNKAAARVYGYTEAEAIGQNILDLIVPPDKRPETIEIMRRMAAGDEVPSFETERRTRSGRLLDIWLTVTALKDRSGRPISFATTERDVTDWRATSRRLEASSRFANALFENCPAGLQVFEADGSFSRMNEAQRRLPPLPQKHGEQPVNVLESPLLASTPLGAAFRKAYDGKVVEIPEATLGTPGGGSRKVVVQQTLYPVCGPSGRVDAVVSLCFDTTERKLAGELHAQRLESLGVLAGGIAHDFNNLLAAMLGNIELARETLPSGHEASRRLETALNALGRAQDLSRQMLAYSGHGSFEIKSLDLGALVEEHVKLLQAGLPKRVRIVCSLAASLPSVAGDPGQIQQVVMNLVTNAVESFGDRNGVVTVTAAERRVGSGEASAAPSPYESVPVGHYVEVAVADEGRGMDEATLARMFDPFFTTKATGRGLGLSAVQGIVRSHGGALAVESEPGRGTAVRFLLPVTSAAVMPAPAPEAQARDVGDDAGLTGKTLVIDDEDLVRRLFAEVLTSRGLEVVAACDGAEAISLFETCGPVDVVIMDLSMPGPSPAETLRGLRAVDPHVRVLVTSGFARPEVIGQLTGICGFLQKPCRPRALVDAVRKCLRMKPRQSPA